MSKTNVGAFFHFLTLTFIFVGCSAPQTSVGVNTAKPPLPRPIILRSAAEIKLPPPPAIDSIDYKLELAELRALQTFRTPQAQAIAEYWNSGAILRWNEIARTMVTQHNNDPLFASRAYALLSIAQYDTLITVTENARMYNRRMPDTSTSGIQKIITTATELSYPSDHAAIAAASAAVLGYLYPSDLAFLTEKAVEEQESRIRAGVNFRSDIIAGDSLGRQIAERVIARARVDGSDAEWDGTLPKGPGIWYMNQETLDLPVRPLWGKVKPWLMQSSDQFRPKPPPAFGSPEFQTALAEVRHISDTRTPEQTRIAQFWADGKYTQTPAGHWNAIAADLIAHQRLDELTAARVFTILNMALMDAGISCWDAKYTYWFIRPSQADPQITLVVRLPDFPSYTSGHATFSGAASTVLGYFFPDRAGQMQIMAEEAAMSRLYAGIHYRFDSDVGLAMGQAVGKLGIDRAKGDAQSP